MARFGGLLLVAWGLAGAVQAAELPCAPAPRMTDGTVRWRAPQSGGEVTHYRVYRAAKSEGYVEDQFTEFEMQSTPGAVLSASLPGWSTVERVFVVMTSRGPGGESINHSNELTVEPIERVCLLPGVPVLMEIKLTPAGGITGTVVPVPQP